MLKNFLLVFIGGGLGSILRYSVGLTLIRDWPFSTFTVNIIGSLLIGLFIGLFQKNIINESLSLLLVVGFCGGFTTFSSFALENQKMIVDGEFFNSVPLNEIEILSKPLLSETPLRQKF